MASLKPTTRSWVANRSDAWGSGQSYLFHPAAAPDERRCLAHAAVVRRHEAHVVHAWLHAGARLIEEDNLDAAQARL